MRIEDLRYLIQVADTGNISQAAESCYISQQGLSRIINSLEKELGVQLFFRRNNHISLTDVGEVVVAWARQMDDMHRQMLRDISKASTEQVGLPPVDYHIYTTQLVSSTFLPRILSALNLRYPGINLNIVELTPPEVADAVEFTDNCIGIISITDFHRASSNRITSGELVFEPFFRDELMLGVAENSPLAKKDFISCDELETIPLALFHTENMMAQNLLHRDQRPTIALHISSYELCRNMIAHNRAAGLTSVLRDFYSKETIRAIPVEKKIWVSYGCIYEPGIPRTPFVEDLISLVQKELSRLVP